jgi:hypothetical protein
MSIFDHELLDLKYAARYLRNGGDVLSQVSNKD